MIILLAAVAAFGIVLLYSGLTVQSAPRSRRFWGRRLDDLVRESGVKRLSVPGLIALSAALWMMSLLVVAGLTSSIVVASAVSLAAAWLPISWLSTRRSRRRRGFREAWPDAIAGLVAGVRAGVSLPESCLSLVDRGPHEFREGFVAFASTYRASGSFSVGLDRLRDELADPIADRVIAALAMANEVGGTDLVRVLRTLGDFVREDVRVRKEIEARWSWTLTAARVAAAAPWIVLVMMSTRPEAAAAYNSTAGVTVIGAGAVLTVIGYRLMLRAARLPDHRRLR
jgi:tight adherence protein B